MTRFDETKHLLLDGADLAPRFSHTKNWRAALRVGTIVEVCLFMCTVGEVGWSRVGWHGPTRRRR